MPELRHTLRLNALLCLRLADVDLHKRTLLIRGDTEKTHREFMVPATATLYAHLQQLVNRAVAAGFQAEDQLFNPTVLDDVAFGPLNLGLSADEARERAEETLRELGLAGFGNRLTHRLSGGEKKLVSLATVLSMRPSVLLLDEPTNGLDPQTRERIIEILGALPTARIIISHDWDFLAQTTTRFMTIKDGRLLTDIPHLPHRHVHAHPLGDEPHHHHD